MSAATGTSTSPLLYRSLSALTDDVVDRLYNIDSAIPQENPTFLFLVGAPGAGKSSGHARAIATGLLPAGAYATLNLDTLLEALAPFRAASSMAYLLKKSDKTRELTRFSSIAAYQTRKENLGLFKWYNTARPELVVADPETITALNAVRAQFADLTDREADTRLLDLHNAALGRAIARRIPIVYETTLSLNKSSGRVEKVDDIMHVLPTEYKPVMVHITADDLPARVRARQEKQMPADPLPYYRYIPTGILVKLAEATAEAYMYIRDSSKYATIRKRLETFTEVENPFDESRLAALPSPPLFENQRARIVAAYGPGSPYAAVAASAASLLNLKYAPTPKTNSRAKTQKRPRKATTTTFNIVNLTEALNKLTVASPANVGTKNRNSASLEGPPPEVVATMENLIRQVEATNVSAKKNNRIASSAVAPTGGAGTATVPRARTIRTTQKAPRVATNTRTVSSLVASLLKPPKKV
jgi:hypothetical protein